MIVDSKIVVRYAETDQMGVVYHANYLVWFEVGRTEFLEAINQPYFEFEKRGLMSPVLNAEITYGKPLHYGETAIVRTRLTEVTSVKSTFSYEIFHEGQSFDEAPCCSGFTRHCFVRKEDFKPVSSKKVAPELYEAYLKVVEPR